MLFELGCRRGPPASAEQEPAAQPVVTVKQPSDVSSHVLGIGSTVLAGGRAFLGQGFTVMLLLFFFLDEFGVQQNF